MTALKYQPRRTERRLKVPRQAVNKMLRLLNCYSELKRGADLSPLDCSWFQRNVSDASQLASLSVLLARKDRTRSERELLRWIAVANPTIRSLLATKFPGVCRDVNNPNSTIDRQQDADTEELLRRTGVSRIGPRLTRDFIQQLVAGRIPEATSLSAPQ